MKKFAKIAALALVLVLIACTAFGASDRFIIERKSDYAAGFSDGIAWAIENIDLFIEDEEDDEEYEDDEDDEECDEDEEYNEDDEEDEEEDY